MSRIRRGVGLACSGAILFGACQQELVVVDGHDGTGTGTGAGGANGGGGNGGNAPNPTASSSTDGGGCAAAPLPVGNLDLCTETVATVTGGPSECQWCVNDEAGTQYTTKCVGDMCSCLADDKELCTCPPEMPGSCSPSCCPPPWNVFN